MVILELISKEGVGWWEVGERSRIVKRCKESLGGFRVRDREMWKMLVIMVFSDF